MSGVSQEANAGAAAPAPVPGRADVELPSPEEFSEWIKDPAHERAYEAHLQRVIAGEFAGLPPEVVARARESLAVERQRRGLRAVREKFMALKELVERAGEPQEAEERLRECQGLIDEITDALLEVQEPHRTKYLKQVLPIREELHALRVEPD